MKKILTVDDSEDNCALIEEVFGDRFVIIRAGDGHEALDLIDKQVPDLILLDMGMPEMDGWKLASHLKSNSKTKHIPIISVTAYALEGDREACLAAGCDDYMAQPINISKLEKTVEEYLRQPHTVAD